MTAGVSNTTPVRLSPVEEMEEQQRISLETAMKNPHRNFFMLVVRICARSQCQTHGLHNEDKTYTHTKQDSIMVIVGTLGKSYNNKTGRVITYIGAIFSIGGGLLQMFGGGLGFGGKFANNTKLLKNLGKVGSGAGGVGQGITSSKDLVNSQEKALQVDFEARIEEEKRKRSERTDSASQLTQQEKTINEVVQQIVKSNTDASRTMLQ